MVFAWGAWGHQHINKAAIFSLPNEMRVFFYNHADFLTEEAVIPDVRKYALKDSSEGPRHYIDIENYDLKSVNDFPQTYQEAFAKYDTKTLNSNGYLPWYIELITERLTNAMRDGKKTDILLLAGDLAHYVGDAHMPLHTATNHDGQLTNQKGIHGFWESQLPELFGDTYNLNTGPAKYIDDVTKHTWQIIDHTHSLADTLLATERHLKEGFPANKIYDKDSLGHDLKNKYGQLVHSKEYATAYHQALDGMVEKQMRAAIAEVANYWYTAWVNAGKPDLNQLDPKLLTDRNAKYFQEDLKLWEKGKLNGFITKPEY